MKHINSTLSFLALGAMLLIVFSSCKKDDSTLPKGAILLTTEKHQSPSKTSVSGNTVQWVNGDTVWFNVGGIPFGCPVVVSDNTAYVTDNAFPGKNNVVRAYYPPEICDETAADQDLNLNSDAPTVIIPSNYVCHYDNIGRQVLRLPLAAKAPAGADKIEFKHLTAAVKVVIKNISTYDLTLDRVVVSSEHYQLSGAMTLSLTSDDFGVTPQASSNNNSVTVGFTDSPMLAHGGGNTIEVQVPIRPIGTDTQPLRIEIFAHGNGPALNDSEAPSVYSSVTCHYNKANVVSDLGRNVMITAQIALAPNGSTYNSHTTFDFLDNSLFTINNSGTKVRFTKGNLKFTSSSEWGFHNNQYDFYPTQSITGRDVFQQDTARDWNRGTYHVLTSEEWYYILNNSSRTASRFAKARLDIGNGTYVNGLIIFPDSYTHPSGIPLNYINAVNISTGTGIDAPYADFNSYNLTQWTYMEQAGAVFLPAAHASGGEGSGGEGHYWTPSGENDSGTGKGLYFSNYQLTPVQNELVTNSCSIRLVKIIN